MDYRRRYLRRLACKKENKQTEENTVEEKVEEKQNMQNVYLQRLLAKTITPSHAALNSSSGKDLFSTEDIRQKKIKNFQKNNEDRYGLRSPVNNKVDIDNNKYFTKPRYKNNDDATPNSPNEQDRDEDKNNLYKTNTENRLPHNYTRRVKNYTNIPEKKRNKKEEIEIENNQNIQNEKKEVITPFIRKRFQVSASSSNITNNFNMKSNIINDDNKEKEKILNNAYKRRITHHNSPNKSNEKEETDNKVQKNKYLKGYSKNENEQNKDNDRKEDTIVSGKGDEKNEFNTIKESIKVNRNNDFNDYSSKRYTYARQRYKFGENNDKNLYKKNEKKKENEKENVIEIEIIPSDDFNNGGKKKNERFNKDHLAFEDEKELINYMKKNYR